MALLVVNVRFELSGTYLTMVEERCRKQLAQYPKYRVLSGLRTVKSCAGIRSYGKHAATCPVSIEQVLSTTVSRADAGLVSGAYETLRGM